ncbi:MAG: tetratricopeptide repeat protein [Gemmatimonadaceae bacterium]|nr:tetratricopeptide repeat protein [Gemmatimonadaceae bacterium]
MSLTVRPVNTEREFEFALSLARKGETERGISILRDIIKTTTSHIRYSNALSVLLLEAGQVEEALHILQEVVAQHGDDIPSIRLNLGNALVAAGRAEDAVAELKIVLAREPDAPDAWYAAGRALQVAGRPHEAAEHYRGCVALAPEHVEAWSSLSAAAYFAGDTAEAETAARRAVALDPAYDGGHFNLAIALLAQRRWAEGWREYEWRWKSPLLQQQLRPSQAPRWDGSPTPGTVLVWAEQGLGDTMQGARWLPVARARVGRLVFAAPPPLVRHLSSVASVDQVVSLGAPMPSHQAQIPLWSLPHVLGLHTDDAVYGAAIPVVPRATIDTPRLRVGIAWAGSPTHINDRHRSIPVETLVPLLTRADVTWVSLQRDASPSLRALAEAHGLTDLHVEDAIATARDFSDTASVLGSLDLVLTVDSAVAHCAASLGCPTWLLLPRIGLDWRWHPVGHSTRWYDAVRCFRVPQGGTWGDTLAQVGEALDGAVRARAQGAAPIASTAAAEARRAGAEYARNGDWSSAYAAWTFAQRQTPTDYALLVNRSVAARSLRQYAQSASLARESIAVDRTRADGWMQLAHACVMLADDAVAIDAAQRAVACDPNGIESRATLARALERADRLDEALAIYDALLREAPEQPTLRYNRSLVLLKLQRWSTAWTEYEWRWSIAPYLDWRRQWPALPVWDGTPLAGRHLLVRHEQGLGDTLMAARWLPQLVERGSPVTLQVPAPLRRLLAGQVAGVEVVETGTPVRADLVVPMLSLPQRLHAIPEATPAARYLSAPGPMPAVARAMLQNRPRPWIGIVWAGEPTHPFDHLRSRPLSFFDPLRATTPGTWISLQVGPRRADLSADTSPTAPLVDLGGVVHDLADTASILTELDHLIAVDTAVAHLAGALGVTTSLILPRCADWRWGVAGDATSWYRSVRLVRSGA